MTSGRSPAASTFFQGGATGRLRLSTVVSFGLVEAASCTVVGISSGPSFLVAESFNINNYIALIAIDSLVCWAAQRPSSDVRSPLT